MPAASPSRPLVAVSATTEVINGVPRVRLDDAYIRALESVGLIPLVTPPLGNGAHAAELLKHVAGLVLTGGEDVAPARFGAAPHPKTGAPNERRDAWELALATAARERALPTLAICRGIQVLNVALGGTLVQDIPSERRGALDHDPAAPRDARAHEARVVSGSRLAQALGATTLRVNSRHHQAVDRVGEGLREVATAPDGVIEGVEGTGDAWWVVGVQWHPEELTATPDAWDRSLFAAFADRVH